MDARDAGRVVACVVGDAGVYGAVCALRDLRPGVVINAALGALVDALQGVDARVGAAACDALDADAELARRADVVRRVAARAEGALEHFYAHVLLEDVVCSASDDGCVARIATAARAFPYVDNYVAMIEGESAVVRAVVPGTNRLRVAFCGSGPLPLTALLLAGATGAFVTLVDCDPAAVAVSERLIDAWISRGVLPRGCVEVLCADAGSVVFSQHAAAGAAGAPHVQCDVVFVASLVPTGVKELVARGLAELRAGAPAFVVRSAHGLTGRLAYFASPRAALERHLRFVGVVVPATHVDADGAVRGEAQPPVGVFPAEILNSLEVYCSRVAPVRGAECNVAVMRTALVSALADVPVQCGLGGR